jgi:hypothetical protein
LDPSLQRGTFRFHPFQILANPAGFSVQLTLEVFGFIFIHIPLEIFLLGEKLLEKGVFVVDWQPQGRETYVPESRELSGLIVFPLHFKEQAVEIFRARRISRLRLLGHYALPPCAPGLGASTGAGDSQSNPSKIFLFSKNVLERAKFFA